MNLTGSTDFSDIVNKDYVTGTQTVSTVEIEAKVGGSRLTNRQVLTIHNPNSAGSTNDIFYGPSGVTTTTGIVISGGDTVYLPAGDCIAVFLIKAAAGGDKTAVIQELS